MVFAVFFATVATLLVVLAVANHRVREQRDLTGAFTRSGHLLTTAHYRSLGDNRAVR